MEAIMNWGVQVVLWFQQFCPTLDLPFTLFTSMGQEEFFLLLLPLLYWCLDRRIGARLTVLFLLSDYSKAVAKFLIDQPRPFQYDSRVRQLADVFDAAFPSGHASNSVVAWGYLASQFRRAWLWVVAVLAVILISLSRLYLGVHFPHDLLGGFVLGGAMLLLFLWLQPGAERWLAGKGLAWQLGIATGLPLFLVLVFPTENGVTTGATLMGMAVGFALERRWVGFESGGWEWRQLLRFLLGAVILVGLWMGLRLAFSGLEPALLFRFCRYVLTGLWGALGAPWVFVRLKLADRRTG
jgi:membrane-associated phospholipid phosphatase